MKRLATVVCCAVLFFVLCAVAAGPIVLCEGELPAGYLETIKKQSKGFYSNRLPLIPVYVSVESVSHREVFYTVHYFPAGTLGMSYIEEDGFNIVKPLTGL